MEFGDDLVELLLGVLGIGGEVGGDLAQDCELLVELYGNADEGAIGAEELVDLFSHKSYGNPSNLEFLLEYLRYWQWKEELLWHLEIS